MATVQVTRYTPIPPSVYLCKVLSYDKSESATRRGQFYYRWVIQVLAPDLPEDYTGKDTFSILTGAELGIGPKNSLRKFLKRVGFTDDDLSLDNIIELDAALNRTFVGQVETVTKGENQNSALGELVPADYDAYLAATQGSSPVARKGGMPGVVRPGVAPSAVVPVKQKVTSAPPTTNVPRPSAKVVTPAARAAAKVAPTPTPTPTPTPVALPDPPQNDPDTDDADGTESFPQAAEEAVVAAVKPTPAPSRKRTPAEVSQFTGWSMPPDEAGYRYSPDGMQAVLVATGQRFVANAVGNWDEVPAQ
jgi:hypothetical protein